MQLHPVLLSRAGRGINTIVYILVCPPPTERASLTNGFCSEMLVSLRGPAHYPQFISIHSEAVSVCFIIPLSPHHSLCSAKPVISSIHTGRVQHVPRACTQTHTQACLSTAVRTLRGRRSPSPRLSQLKASPHTHTHITEK